MFDCLTLSSDGPIATLELSRPDDSNAFDEILHGEFAAALKELRSKADIRVILLHAAGRHFSAGGNLDYLEKLSVDPAVRQRTRQEGYDSFTLLTEMHVPIVVAVQGHAIGFGATIATSCDVIVAWRGAKLGDPHVRVGLAAGDGGALSWSSAAGFNRARRLLLTGDTITAEQAYDFGLVTDLVDEPGLVLPEATRIAQQIAALPPVAVQGTKRAFNAIGKIRNAQALEVSMMAELESIASDDLKEALLAVRERRVGQYRNR
jgi:enoyl-CoA hydratase